MNLKEAKAAAERLAPVEYDGVRYERISEVGIHYDRNGKRFDFVTLVQGNTTVRVQSEKVKECEQDEVF